MIKASVLLDLWENLLTKRGQEMSVQPDKVESILRAAGLFDVAAQISPLLDKAGVPGNVSVEISMVIDHTLTPKFRVVTNPSSPTGNKLAALITQSYAGQIRKVLIAAKIAIFDPLEIKWVKF